MSKKTSVLKGTVVPRSLAASLAGIRAGGALAVDNAVQTAIQKVTRRESSSDSKELGRLKGTYVKIGQMLALFGEQFLPHVLVEALRDLSDQTEPLHWDALESFVRDSLGELYAELDIDPQAVAAASLAQVHLARIRDNGEWICLKIQYPGLAQVIDADFDVVVRMLLVARWVKAGRDLDDWLESMREHLHQEIDYQREADMTVRIGHLCHELNGERTLAVPLHSPQLHSHFCTDSILAMEYIEGFSVVDADVGRLSLERRNNLAQTILELFFVEVFEWGLMQTDPNFGNYLLRLDDRRKKSGQDELVLLDFGSMLEPDDAFLFHLRNAIDSGLRQDVPVLVESLVGLGCISADAAAEAQQSFADFCLHLLEPLRPPEQLPAEYLNAQGEYCWANSKLMRRAGKQAAISASSRHFTPPSRDFALIARKLSGLFNFIATLEAEFNAHAMVESYLEAWNEKQKRGGKKQRR
jgi:predicted unusual protein kinase regulating ubiquinone biosynthesis (AarF/ABC1/UbiB family)